MVVPILTTKLYIPSPPPQAIARPDLVRRLLLEQRLTLVSAPAGFGKTTLLGAYAAQADRPVAWLSLDGEDNDTSSFWAYVIAALQTVQVDLGTSALVALHSPPSQTIDPVLLSLLNDLSMLDSPLTLVLDDYHAITSLEIHETLRNFLQRLPPTVHLIIATRQDPPFSLSRWRLNRQLSEIRAADLRFSQQEISQLLNEVMALDLPTEDIAALDTRTEGWIAGLQLAALSLRETVDRSGLIRAFAGSHRFLTDYLVDEVLSRQPADIQRFLRRTSILERFCAELCNAVVDATDSRRTLRQLEQANLFLIPLDDERRWFRYHHLFSDFLHLRLLENEPDVIPELHGRAIDWFDAAGLRREALHQALAAKSWDRAADLIEVLAPSILERDNHMLVIQWAETLPDEMVHQRPYLCAYLGWAWVIAAKMETAYRWLSQAEVLSDGLEAEDARTVRAHVDAHRAYILFLQGKYAQAIAPAERALDALRQHEAALRARTITCLGNAYNYSGQLVEAKEAFRNAIVIAREIGSLSLAMFAYGSLGEVYRDEGQLAKAMDAYQRLLRLAEDLTGEPDGPLTGYAHFEIGDIYREWYELDTAVEKLKKGVRLCREWQQGEALGIGLLDLAETHRLRGELAESEAAIAEAREVAVGISPWAVNLVEGFAARLALSRGDIAEASRWATRSGLDDAACEIGYERFPECPALVRVQIATGRSQRALALTERLVARDRAAGRMGRVLDMLVLQAAALSSMDRKNQATEVLAEAVELAGPHNHIRPFADEGPALRECLRRLPPSPHRDRLLSIFGEGDPPTPSTDAPETTITDPLSDREIAILRLMAAGLANREIGAELYLSVNTVRWYASRIYSKLDVKRRGEAVARARETGIL